MSRKRDTEFHRRDFPNSEKLGLEMTPSPLFGQLLSQNKAGDFGIVTKFQIGEIREQIPDR